VPAAPKKPLSATDQRLVNANASVDSAANEVRSIFEKRMVSRMEILMDGQVAFSYLSLDDFSECEAENSDAEALIDTLRSVRGVRAACILKERNGFVRGSLRAKDDDTDVAAMSAAAKDACHRAAAGFTLEVSLEEAIARVKDELSRL
jgi:phosphoesterase RecJ-like protein